MQSIAVYNLKGGVGKTATAVNLAYLSAQSGLPTLLWDLDPQAAAGWYFKVSAKERFSARKLASDRVSLGKCIRATEHDHLDVLPADLSLRQLDLHMEQQAEANRFADWLQALGEQYAAVFLDCPPTLSTANQALLSAVDVILMPVLPTHLSFQTAVQVKEWMKTEKMKRKHLHPVLTQIDRRKQLHQQFAERCKEMLGKPALGYIPYASDIEKMGSYRAPVQVFAPHSPAAAAYRQLWNHLREHYPF